MEADMVTVKNISEYKPSKFENPILLHEGVLHTYNTKTKVITEYYPEEDYQEKSYLNNLI